MKISIEYTSAVRQRAGIGRYTRSLVAALARVDDRNDYRLLIPNDAGVLAPAMPANFRIARAPLSERALAVIWQRLSVPLPVELLTGPADVFYSPDFVLPPTRARRKILTIHDLSFKRVPETAVPKLKWYLEGAVPRAIARADLILADSETTRRDVVELFGAPPERVQTLYLGVDSSFHPVEDQVLAAARERYGLERPFILSVGTLEPRKNLVRLIESFARLRQRGELDLLIAGAKGWLYDDILAAPERFGVAERVRFLDFVPEGDLPALYSSAAVFAYPSLYEGFGLPVLEAMACGAPVVTGNNSSLPEVAGDAALLVDVRRPEEICHALAQVLDDGAMRSELRRRGLERAARFTWDASARQLREALEA